MDEEKERLFRRYNLLKEKVIDKYDYYFHKYLLMDISEVRYVDYLIDDESEFLYNLDLALELKNTIDAYIDYEKYSEVLIKLIELKRIIDKRILSNPKYNQNDVNYFVFDIENDSSIKPIIKFNHKVTNKEIILQEIYTFLNNEGYIECTSDIFHSHFEPSKDWDYKILWVGENLISLVGLIDDLFVRNILPSRKKRRLRNKTVLNHFKSEKGDLNEGSVKTEGTNIFDTKKYKKIHDFINSLEVDFD